MSEDDEQFNQAFGEHTGISTKGINYINRIRQLFRVKEFSLYRSDADRFTDLAWRLLGRYIANSNHLEKITLSRCGITDEKMASLFSELTHCTSLKQLDLSGNSFGINGVRSIIPLLHNSPYLSKLQVERFAILNFDRNNNIKTDCFELLVQTLHRRPLKGRSLIELVIGSCNITNISALDRYTITNLRSLQLYNNEIGNDGCRTLSNMLQQQGSNLECLDLDRTGINDEGAALLATSLENNTKLKTLSMRWNNIKEGEGHLVFLKLLIDARSIKNTYNSNHTLESLNLCSSRQGTNSTKEHIQSGIQIRSALEVNKSNYKSHAAGRIKVIKYQLNSRNRKTLCRLQGIEYSSIGNLFADIEPTLLPRILALIGRKHGQSEMYTALIPMVPDLMSCVDTRGMMKSLLEKDEAHANDLAVQMAELTRQQAALSAKIDKLSRRLAVRESGDRRHSTKEEVGTEESMAAKVERRDERRREG